MTGRGIGYLILLALTLLAGLATGVREIYFVVFCLALVLLYSLISALWGALALRAAPVYTAMAAVRGDTTRFDLRLGGFALLPVVIKAWVQAPFFPIAAVKRPPKDTRLLLYGPVDGEKALSLAIFCPHRGVWDVGVRRLRVQDIFGFFSFPLPSGHRPPRLLSRLTVYPAVTELAGDPRPSSLMEEYAESSTAAADHGDSFSGTRQYRDGDSLKRIHWIQSIRTRQLFTRQYDVCTAQLTVLLLDTLLPAWANPAGCGDMMTECAASLAFYHLGVGLPLRLYCPYGNVDYTARSMDDFSMLYDALATVPFQNLPAPFDPALLAGIGQIRSLYIMTNRLSREMLDALQPLVISRCAVVCLVPPSEELPQLNAFAAEIGVRVEPILCPEDIAAKLGDCL